jgi:hypothetical protein
MELNFEEMNNLDNQQNLNSNSYNIKQNDKNEYKYWEQAKKEIPKKKKVSFDDILNNMNLVVNQDGVLQYMRPLQEEPPYYQNQNYQNQNYQNQNYQTQNYQQKEPIQNMKNSNAQPIDPSVKHSYIYNKYFSDYKDNNVPQQGPRRPQTIAELKQILRDDKIREIQHKIRISQIKSKKMLFTNVHVTNVRGIQTTKNNLRSLSFK